MSCGKNYNNRSSGTKWKRAQAQELRGSLGTGASVYEYVGTSEVGGKKSPEKGLREVLGTSFGDLLALTLLPQLRNPRALSSSQNAFNLHFTL